jgi:hypothetical protein
MTPTCIRMSRHALKGFPYRGRTGPRGEGGGVLVYPNPWLCFYKNKFILGMTKHSQTGWNLGWVFNSRCGRVFLCHANTLLTKQPNLKLKTQFKITFRFSPVIFHIPFMWPLIMKLNYHHSMCSSFTKCILTQTKKTWFLGIFLACLRKFFVQLTYCLGCNKENNVQVCFISQ